MSKTTYEILSDPGDDERMTAPVPARAIDQLPSLPVIVETEPVPRRWTAWVRTKFSLAGLVGSFSLIFGHEKK